ncbi:MAG: hypothetical protein JXR37_27840 [Kiritimatiellae bacterium]|nr:hypothetical protein [Kiritimatiellia bacterium]
MKLKRGVFLSLVCLLIFGGCGGELRAVRREWRGLCEAGGTLEGYPHWDPQGPPEGSAFLRAEWEAFFQRPRAVTIPFLMEQLASTTRTAVDTGAWGKATEGALAVYAAEHILGRNWFECDESLPNLTRYAERARRSTANITAFMLPDVAARQEAEQYFYRVLRKLEQQAE